MTFTSTTRLKKLSDTGDYKVAGDSHDIRGWAVVNEQGVELGSVDDLLYDVDTEQVRYVIVKTPERHVLIPLGALGFEPVPRRVVATGYAQVRLGTIAPFLTSMMVDGFLTPEAERASYLASVPGYKDNDPLDYGIPTFTTYAPEETL